ncbi:GNAT family N-acetyltransferase [Virgibacillus phasianinus]|uniref:GNAT family N-acetyltransferase n=1 Tax=Virgibacillus phasianinus TaxID=2017483 RepID=A0A220U0J0_9BACI|nr:GNAT family N-acetyltransferase [Virgibacillus phasianinus]ASK61495.1 GNAT family N-acetyltransferase [Virgibacillus phasianinus]
MCEKLNACNQLVAQDILNIQLLAYKIEAELIGFDGIPQLNDTVESIMASKETFIGYNRSGKLAGFISYQVSGNELDICRLVVHPDCFRMGTANSLLKYIMNKYKYSIIDRYTVSTGSKNVPAIRLYKQFGFIPYQEIEISKGISICLLAKEKTQA